MADKTGFFREAQKHLSKGQVDKAIAVWEDYVTHNPDGNVFNTIGDLYYRKGKREKAVEFFHKSADYFKHEGFLTKAQALFKKILNLAPNDAKALHQIGLLNEEKGLITDAIKYYLAAVDAYAKEGSKDALKHVSDKIVDLAPTNLSLRVKLAQYMQKEGYIDEAAREYLSIGRVCEEKGDIDQAREYYEKALEIYPRLFDIYAVLYDFFFSQGEFDKARKLLNKGIELYPEKADLDVNLSELMIAGGDLEGAKNKILALLSREDFEEDGPLSVKASRLLADIYVKEGKEDLAWESFRVVLDDHLRREEYDDAVSLLTKYRNLAPEECTEKLVEIYGKTGAEEELFNELVSLGDIKIDKGHPEEALSYLKDALKFNSASVDVARKVSRIESDLGITDEPVKEEKSLDEKLVDADIFVRYGLMDEALDVLEKLRVEEPENMEVHRRLKNIYLEKGDRESAVTECLILARLFEREGSVEQREQVIKEAFDIDPDDPRLVEMAKGQEGMATSTTLDTEFQGVALEGIDEGTVKAFSTEETVASPDQSRPGAIEEYSEELAEAEFYFRQGLYQDALSIYERVYRIFPDNKDIEEKIKEIEVLIPGGDTEQGEPSRGEESVEEVVQGITGEVEASVDRDPGEDTVEEDVPEPSLDSEVLDIFEEFKKGISEQLEDEDYETHYNLGIAYKEMGLIDDAIKEFQMARSDPERKIHVLSMLGICYMEKKLYSLAIDAFQEASKNMTGRDESYWGLKYDLAGAYENNGDLKNALDIYIAIYGWDSKFRSINEKVSSVKQRLGAVKDVAEVVEEDNKKPKKDRISYI